MYDLHTEKRKPNQKVGQHEWCRAIKTVVTFFDEVRPVFEKGGHVCHCHEAHKRRTKELGGQQAFINISGDKLTIALINGWICSCVVLIRSHTVPIIIARPAY